ncbi:MAG: endonuclease/exonuclease/phosphatase family protein [Pseudomonadota bacterium]|nr:MAG: endonuclease/exonuclease/phosphatase family protein [Pseudomonadota bacterium]
MSYNIQVGISSSRPHHYFTHSWKHVLPHTTRLVNIEQIARRVHEYDIVGLQEVDAGSLRSNFINLTEFMAERAGFPFWYHQVNRNLGRIAQHSNGLLSRLRPTEMRDLRLPGLIPGRRAILARFGSKENPLVLFVLHLALSRRARLSQIDYVSDIVNEYPHAIVMGDMNCRPGSREMSLLFRRTHLHEPIDTKHTFPSWRPQHNIDHILVSSDLVAHDVHVHDYPYSDHLPISMRIELPESIDLPDRAKAHMTAGT